MKKYLLIYVLLALVFSACKDNGATKLLFQGNASVRLTAKNGTVIYIDPIYGEGYDVPADIILVTHEHSDHINNELIEQIQKKSTTIIKNAEAQKGGKYNTFKVKGVKIEAVEAYNASHNRVMGVGYIITIDGIQVYHAGDSNKTAQMETFPARNLDYVLLPCDGTFNMDAEKAAACAEFIGGKHNIPIHTGPFDTRGNPKELFNRNIAERFNPSNRLIIEPGEEIELVQSK